MWWVFQSFIIGGVTVHNAYYHWTPNPILAGAIGVGLAYLATRIVWKMKGY